MLPPASFVHEQEKVNERWPAAVRFIEERRLNEFFAEGADDIGIIVQGGSYNTLMRALERLGLADVYGNSKVPLYVMNVAYPVIDSEVLRFCEGKRAVLMVEEGPAQLHRAEHRDDPAPGRLARRRCTARTCCRWPANTPRAELLKGARAFLERYGRIEPLQLRRCAVARARCRIGARAERCRR